MQLQCLAKGDDLPRTRTFSNIQVVCVTVLFRAVFTHTSHSVFVQDDGMYSVLLLFCTKRYSQGVVVVLTRTAI